MATSKNVSRGPSQQPPFRSNKTECDTHGQQLRKYCKSHLMPCCDECISKSHSKCSGITSLASIVEKTKIEKSKESVGKDINSILQFLDKMVNNKSENIQRGEKQYQSIKESIREFKMEINKHLDKLEKKLCKEADTIWGQEKSKLTDFIKEIEEQKKRLNEMQDELRTVQEHTSKLQSFLGLHQIEQQVHQCQRYVDEQNETVREVDIKLKQNDEIQILSKVQSLTSLGEVNVDETEITLRKEASFDREGQVELQYQPNINNMTMTIETKIPINVKSFITISDMICLLDGRIIVVEHRGNVSVLTSDGKLQKQLPVDIDGARNVTLIKQDTIAVTYPVQKTIWMINIENETTTKVKLDKRCFGLSFSNNALVVGLGKNEIRIIDLEGNTLKSIEVLSESPISYLVQWKDRVIYGDRDGKAVNCIDRSGKQIWQYQQDKFGPRGLCTDTYGNIFVADPASNRLIVISKDGQESKVLISEEEGMKLPICICLNESSGFISNTLLGGICIVKFNISYE
ncbi:uncharacterized protein LOC143058586 [Mytilus galloprovincialis]|uniref:uncharacterized protein LOC143058586 n=1 Tax=Mytilus galloprovincialis TaxID=29158 RepID=UPI003F7C39CA